MERLEKKKSGGSYSGVEDHVEGNAALPHLEGLYDDADVVVPDQRNGGLEGVHEHSSHAGLRPQSGFALISGR